MSKSAIGSSHLERAFQSLETFPKCVVCGSRSIEALHVTSQALMVSEQTDVWSSYEPLPGQCIF